MAGLFYFIQPVQGVWIWGLIRATHFMGNCQKKKKLAAWLLQDERFPHMGSGGPGWDWSAVRSWLHPLILGRLLNGKVERQVWPCISGFYSTGFLVEERVNLDGVANKIYWLCQWSSYEWSKFTSTFQPIQVVLLPSQKFVCLLHPPWPPRWREQGREAASLVFQTRWRPCFVAFSFELAFGQGWPRGKNLNHLDKVLLVVPQTEFLSFYRCK